MNLRPSKLSDAANQVWKESTSLFQNTHDVKIDLGLEKTLNKSAGDSSENKPVAYSGYIFGSKLIERTGLGTEKEGNLKSFTPTDVSSIFKKVLQNNPSKNLWKTSPEKVGEDTSNSDRLKASIDELTKKSQPNTELNSAEPITTGEEDERNLANISCKFFYYNPDTKAWVERGMGTFRVKQSNNNREEIRLVGRTTGGQRVIINSKIFNGMVLEQLSEKRLKISAQNSDVELPQLFILHASPASIASVRPILEEYITSAKPAVTSSTVAAPESRKRKTTDEKEEGDEEDKEPPKKAVLNEDSS